MFKTKCVNRGTKKSYVEDKQARKTQYGVTSRYGNLELHCGDTLIGERAGLKNAFLFDEIDHHYNGLMQSMGVGRTRPLGALIGVFCGKDEDTIRFRITKQSPKHLLLCYAYDPEWYDSELLRRSAVAKTMARIGDSRKTGVIYAVFPLTLVNQENDPREDYCDGKYDMGPDYADMYYSQSGGITTTNDVINFRLQMYGFFK